MTYQALIWFVDISNASSLVVITVCFILTAFFVAFVGMNTDLSSRGSHVSAVEQRSMVKVVNPFFLQLTQQNKCLKDGLSLHLSSLCACKLVVLWGVNIEEFHSLILKQGQKIRQSLLSASASEDGSQYNLAAFHIDNIEFAGPGDNNIFLPCPEGVDAECFGGPPRKHYPVAVFVFVSDDGAQCPLEADGAECANNIVGSIAMIHLRDDLVQQQSHIIGQYIKTAGVPIYSLQPLYVSNPSDQANSDNASYDFNSEERTTSAGGGLGGDDNVIKGSRRISTKNSDDVSLSQDKKQEHLYNETSENNSALSDLNGSDILTRSHRDATCDDIRLRKNQGQSQTLSAEERENKDNVISASCSNSIEEGRDSEVNQRQTANDADNFAVLAECVVCQSRRAVCALLPCRHACVCRHCFKLLERCPMCRGTIASYFLMSGECTEEEESENEGEFERAAVNATFAEHWRQLNIRLNNFFGFT